MDLSIDDDFNGWSLAEEYAFGFEPGGALVIDFEPSEPMGALTCFESCPMNTVEEGIRNGIDK